MTDNISEARDKESYLQGMRFTIRAGLDRSPGVTVENAQMRAYIKIVMKQEVDSNASDQS